MAENTLISRMTYVYVTALCTMSLDSGKVMVSSGRTTFDPFDTCQYDAKKAQRPRKT